MTYYRRRRQRDPDATPPMRTPPAVTDIEHQLLAAAIIDPEIIPDLLPQLDPAEFYSPACVDLAKAIIKLHGAGNPIDLATVSQEVKSISAADLAAWADNSFPSQWPSYLRIVKETAFARSLLNALGKACDRIYEKAGDAHDSLATLINDLVRLQQNDTVRDFQPIITALIEAQKIIQNAVAGATGIPTGFRDFDARIGGLQRGELIIVAGRPGMGKTAFAQAIVLNAARAGYGAAFASLEMTAGQIGMRLISGETGIESRDLRRGRLQDRDFPRIVSGVGRLGSLNIHVLDSDRSWVRLKSKIRALKLRQPEIAVIAVDYIGLIDGETDKDRYLEIGMISAECKELAKILSIAIILCSQLNRAVENRTDKKPQLSDLRESGNLEQDADLVLLLNRPSYYDPTFEPSELTILDVAKNRQGPLGPIKISFNGATVLFTDWTEPPAPRDITAAKGAEALV